MRRLALLTILLGFGCSDGTTGTQSSTHKSTSRVTMCANVQCPNIQTCPDGSAPAMLPGECCETCGGMGGGGSACDPSFGLCQTDADCPQTTGTMITLSCQNGCCIPSAPDPCQLNLPCPDGSVPIYWNGQCECKQPPIPGQCCDGTFGQCMTAADCPTFPGATVDCVNGCCTPGAPPPPCDPRQDPMRCCACPDPQPCPPGQSCPPVMCDCPPPPPPPCDPATNPMCGCVCPLDPCMVNPDGSVTCPPCNCPPPCDPTTGQNCCMPDANGNNNCPPPPPPPCDPTRDPNCGCSTDPSGNTTCCMPGDPNCQPPPPPPTCMPGDPNCPPQPLKK